MKVKISKLFIPIVIISMLIINSALFYTVDKMKVFIALFLTSTSIYTIYTIINARKVIPFFYSKFFVWIIILFAMFYFYSYVFPVYDNFFAGHLMVVCASTVIICSLYTSIPKEEIINTLKKVSVIVIAFICSYVLLNEYSSIINGGIRIGNSGSGNVNTIAMYLGLLSIPLLYDIIIDKKKKNIFIYFISIVFILLTGSKKGLLTIILSLMVLIVYKNKYKITNYIKYLIILLIFLVAIFKIDYLYNVIGKRVYSFFGEIGIVESNDSSFSTSQRKEMYKASPKIIARSPIFGLGWGYFTKNAGFGYYSHSNYIELLVTFGILGTLFYYIPYIKYFYNRIAKRRKTNNENILFLTMLVVILVNDISAVTFTTMEINYIISFVALLCTQAKGDLKNDKNT